MLEIHSGNLDRPQKNWSAWTAVDPSTKRIASPPARFLQYRVTLTAAGKAAPALNGIDIAYLPKNAAPVLDIVESTPANYRFAVPVLSASTPTAPTGSPQS